MTAGSASRPAAGPSGIVPTPAVVVRRLMVQSQSPQWSLLEDGRWLATFVGGDTGLLTAVQGRLSGRGGGPNLARALATLVVAAGEIEEAVRARARGS